MLWYARGEPLKLLLRNKLQTWFNFSRRRKHAYKLISCLPAQQEALSAVSFRMRQTWAWLLLSQGQMWLWAAFSASPRLVLISKVGTWSSASWNRWKGRAKQCACVTAWLSCPLIHTRLHLNPGNFTKNNIFEVVCSSVPLFNKVDSSLPVVAQLERPRLLPCERVKLQLSLWRSLCLELQEILSDLREVPPYTGLSSWRGSFFLSLTFQDGNVSV